MQRSQTWSPPSLGRLLISASSMVALVSLGGCSTTRWTPVEQRPLVLRPYRAGSTSQRAPVLRVRPVDTDAWLVLNNPRLEADSAISWTPNPARAKRVTGQLSSLYWRGRVNLRDLEAIEVGEARGVGTTTVVATAAGTVVGVVLLAVALQDVFVCAVTLGLACES